MNIQKQQTVSALMDNDKLNDSDIERLISDSEMRSIWARFHLIQDVLKNDVAEKIDLNLANRINAAISAEPTVLAPTGIKNKTTNPTGEGIVTTIRGWAEQATGFAIAASVTAIMIFGVQTLNRPVENQTGKSAITSLELLEVEELQITEQTEYSPLQENLLDFTRQSSLYGLHSMKPYVGVVNHQVTVPLTLIKSDFAAIQLENELKQKEKENKTEPETSQVNQ